MSAEVELISTMTEKKASTKPPIQMEFQVLNQIPALVTTLTFHYLVAFQHHFNDPTHFTAGSYVYSIGFTCAFSEGNNFFLYSQIRFCNFILTRA